MLEAEREGVINLFSIKALDNLSLNYVIVNQLAIKYSRGKLSHNLLNVDVLF